MAQATVKDEKEGRRAFWERHLTRWRRSGLPVRTYCTREGLSAWSFYAWRRRLGKEACGTAQTTRRVSAPPGEPVGRRGAGAAVGVAAAVGFVEVGAGALLRGRVDADTRPADGAVRAGYVEVRVSEARGIRVWPGFDGETLRRVVAVLEGGSC